MPPVGSCLPCGPDPLGAYNVNSSSECKRLGTLRPDATPLCPQAQDTAWCSSPQQHCPPRITSSSFHSECPCPQVFSSQVHCGQDLSTPNPLPHSPVRHPSSHDSLFCLDFICRIWENTQRVQGVRGDEPSWWVGSDEKGEWRRTFPVPLVVLFRPNPPTSSVLLPAPPEPFVYAPRSSGHCPLSTFRSRPSPIHLVCWTPYCPLRHLTVCLIHSFAL